jgi:hypothetical protein
MADSVRPVDLIAGYDAYLTYVDGDFKTDGPVRQRYPKARFVSLTVLGGKASADGCDRENGDLSAEGAARWVQYRLSSGAWKPVVYASISNMAEVISELSKLGIGRDQVRLLSAHYGLGQHICGPKACPDGKKLGLDMDGTQWTDKASGFMHSEIDASLLASGFFSKTTTTWEDNLMSVIAEIKKGSTGQAVRNWQGVLVAHGYDLGASGQFRDGIDGSFEDVTDEKTREFQKSKSLKDDGIVGQQTWTAALT